MSRVSFVGKHKRNDFAGHVKQPRVIFSTLSRISRPVFTRVVCWCSSRFMKNHSRSRQDDLHGLHPVDGYVA